ncbi:MAG: restriction endonuclease [Chitinophagales bacterium]|nr:restriction endonuclease [Chitinophagales bacterium]
MLNETDVHYLVAFLTRIAEGNEVELELGAMVYDNASEHERDIDVTIRRTSKDGTIAKYKGIEVKKHKRPLDVIQVEQLCMKFSDMPAITHKAIVSASGYTAPAVKKAKTHGVELLEIIDWKDGENGFHSVQIDKANFFMSESGFAWASDINIELDVDSTNIPIQILEKVTSKDTIIILENNEGYPEAGNMGELNANIRISALRKLREGGTHDLFSPNEVKDVQINFPFENHAYALVEDYKVRIRGAVIKALVKYQVFTRKPVFRVLRKIGSDEVLAACVITEMLSGRIIGFSFAKDTGLVSLNIPFEERKRSKPYRQKF